MYHGNQQIFFQGTKPLEHQMQLASVEAKMEDIESERYVKFKTYRELTESQSSEDPPGVYLCDRHNYFTKFHAHLKKAAKEVLHDPSYGEEYESQVMNLLHALKIKPRVTKVPAEKTVEPIIQIDVNCEYDVVFANIREKVYKNVLEYFNDMLD